MRKLLFLLLVSVSLSYSQKITTNLSGSLKNDTRFVLSALSDSSKSYNLNIEIDKKTPILAGLMSFAIPGAGQIYTENYLTAGIFAAVEIAALVVAIKYDAKGDDQTEFFENYANQNWSAEQYAKWTINNISSLNPSLVDNLANYKVFDNEDNLNWNELNKLEGAIGGYYSHKLAPFGDQQYYEMIGKYSQFNVGWNTFGDENTSYIWGVDEVVDQFKWYSKERGKANDYYNVSKWAVITIVTNHFVSALEAAWSASRYNKKLKINFSLEEENIGYYKEYYPQLNLSYNF